MDRTDYKVEIAKERLIRKQQRMQAIKLSQEIDGALNALSGNSDNPLVDVELFANLDIGQPYEVKDGVTFIPILYGRDIWVFDTYLRAGCGYGEHLHKIREACEVITGQLYNKTKNLTYNIGDKVEFLANELHEPMATQLSDAHYRVTFFINEINLTPAQ